MNSKLLHATWILQALALASTVAAADIELPSSKEGMVELGRRHATAWELYQYFLRAADGGDSPGPRDLPDWSGVYSRGGIIFNFDSDQGTSRTPTAKLTPEFARRLEEKLERIARGIEYDPLSECAPPGHPRWLTEPFLREFAPLPHQTWLINEMVNDIRRVYTDGRGHTPEEDAYPTYNGDSIGFWDNGRLVVHTNQLMSGQYQRTQPEYTEAVETVEIWEKADDRNIVAHVWVYDPPALEEPWYAKQTYTKLSDQESLRIRYWHCSENPNNEVIQTEEGGSDFRNFTFDDR